MYLTEQEAGRKYCHKAILANIDFPAKCCGTRCMAWQWAEALSSMHPEKGVFDPMLPATEKPDSQYRERRGYCGLVIAVSDIRE